MDGFELSQRTVSVFGSPLLFMPQKNSFESKRENLKVHRHCQKRREVELRFAFDILFLWDRHELCQKDLESLKMGFLVGFTGNDDIVAKLKAFSQISEYFLRHANSREQDFVLLLEATNIEL
jgi:hypothetical protein